MSPSNMLRVVVLALGFVVFSACDGAGTGVLDDAQAGRAVLRAAVDRTLRAPHLHVETVLEWEADQVTERIVFDYRAPDRTRTVSEQDGKRTEVIEVGERWWSSKPGDTGRYWRSNPPPDGGLTHLATLLRDVVLQASEVTRVAGRFSLEWDDEDDLPLVPTEGTVTIRRGHVVRLELAGPEASGVPTRTMVEIAVPERPPEIEAPPPAQVDEARFGAEQSCGPEDMSVDVVVACDFGWPSGDD